MRRIAAALCLAWITLTCAHAGEEIRYPRPESSLDKRNEYARELLKLSLHEAGSNARLVPSENVMSQERMFSEIEAGKNLQVFWVMTTKEREKRALAIRIPIYKGMIGWRLALVHASRSALFSQVHSLSDLANFSAGQARDWPDVEILQANNLHVVTASGYENLFSMLGQGRFDYLPRSVAEIWAEAELHREDGVVVDPYIVIHYPAAVYFFVNASNHALAETINTGLNRAIADGKFDRLFYSYFAAAIERARLGERNVIELKNPSLPGNTPLNRADLWLRLPRAASSGDRTPKSMRH